MAHSGDRHYLVIMPDFFEGQAANWEWYPDDTPEKAEKLQGFLDGPGDTKKTVEKVMKVHAAAEQTWNDIKEWEIVRYCWGGWVASYCIGPGTPFSAAAELHPGFVGKHIAQKINIPVFAIASKDEADVEVSG